MSASKIDAALTQSETTRSLPQQQALYHMYHISRCLWLYNNNTHSTAVCRELPRWAAGTRKVKPSRIYWSRRQWVAVASAATYASLHHAQDT